MRTRTNWWNLSYACLNPAECNLIAIKSSNCLYINDTNLKNIIYLKDCIFLFIELFLCSYTFFQQTRFPLHLVAQKCLHSLFFQWDKNIKICHLKKPPFIIYFQRIFHTILHCNLQMGLQFTINLKSSKYLLLNKSQFK